MQNYLSIIYPLKKASKIIVMLQYFHIAEKNAIVKDIIIYPGFKHF